MSPVGPRMPLRTLGKNKLLSFDEPTLPMRLSGTTLFTLCCWEGSWRAPWRAVGSRLPMTKLPIQEPQCTSFRPRHTVGRVYRAGRGRVVWGASQQKSASLWADPFGEYLLGAWQVQVTHFVRGIDQ